MDLSDLFCPVHLGNFSHTEICMSSWPMDLSVLFCPVHLGNFSHTEICMSSWPMDLSVLFCPVHLGNFSHAEICMVLVHQGFEASQFTPTWFSKPVKATVLGVAIVTWKLLLGITVRVECHLGTNDGYATLKRTWKAHTQRYYTYPSTPYTLNIYQKIDYSLRHRTTCHMESQCQSVEVIYNENGV